jgi:hypothetical protein
MKLASTVDLDRHCGERTQQPHMVWRTMSSPAFPSRGVTFRVKPASKLFGIGSYLSTWWARCAEASWAFVVPVASSFLGM